MDISELAPIGPAFEPVSPDAITTIEGLLGQRLPDDYREFLKTYGRCGFSGEAAVVTAAERFPIFTLYGGDTEAGSLLQQLALHPDLQEIGVLPIADDLFNNIYVFDFQEGRISRLDYSSGQAVATQIATTFEDFLARIEVTPDEPL